MIELIVAEKNSQPFNNRILFYQGIFIVRIKQKLWLVYALFSEAI
ncbi:MAG: hypothetical protein ACLS36_09125 [Streptococcus sp.]